MMDHHATNGRVSGERHYRGARTDQRTFVEDDEDDVLASLLGLAVDGESARSRLEQGV